MSDVLNQTSDKERITISFILVSLQDFSIQNSTVPFPNFGSTKAYLNLKHQGLYIFTH